jgi:hypothetical protein
VGCRGADGWWWLPADLRLLSVDVPTTVPNSRSFEPDAWIPTQLLRRPSDPLSNRIKFLSASAVIGVLAGYFIFGNSDRRADVTVAPERTTGIPFVALRETGAPSTKATNMTVESRAVPEGEMASLEPVVRLDIKPNGGADAGRLQTLQERGKQLPTDDGHDATCFPSASAVLMYLPGAGPSWTPRGVWTSSRPTARLTRGSDRHCQKVEAGFLQRAGMILPATRRLWMCGRTTQEHGHHGLCERLVMKALNAGTPGLEQWPTNVEAR